MTLKLLLFTVKYLHIKTAAKTAEGLSRAILAKRESVDDAIAEAYSGYGARLGRLRDRLRDDSNKALIRIVPNGIIRENLPDYAVRQYLPYYKSVDGKQLPIYDIKPHLWLSSHLGGSGASLLNPFTESGSYNSFTFAVSQRDQVRVITNWRFHPLTPMSPARYRTPFYFASVKQGIINGYLETRPNGNEVAYWLDKDGKLRVVAKEPETPAKLKPRFVLHFLRKALADEFQSELLYVKAVRVKAKAVFNRDTNAYELHAGKRIYHFSSNQIKNLVDAMRHNYSATSFIYAPLYAAKEIINRACYDLAQQITLQRSAVKTTANLKKIFVSFEDSRAAGNCAEISMQFAHACWQELGFNPCSVRLDEVVKRRRDNHTANIAKFLGNLKERGGYASRNENYQPFHVEEAASCIKDFYELQSR